MPFMYKLAAYLIFLLFTTSMTACLSEAADNESPGVSGSEAAAGGVGAYLTVGDPPVNLATAMVNRAARRRGGEVSG